MSVVPRACKAKLYALEDLQRTSNLLKMIQVVRNPPQKKEMRMLRSCYTSNP